MDRRTFVGGVVGSSVVWPHAAMGQQVGKLARVGILWPGYSTNSGNLAAFEEELRARGWVEGRNILIDRRSAEGRSERYGALAAELVRLNVDVIVPAGGAAGRDPRGIGRRTRRA